MRVIQWLSAVALSLMLAGSLTAQTRPEYTAGLTPAEARAAEARYGRLEGKLSNAVARYNLKAATVRAIAVSVGARNPTIADDKLIEAVAALSGDAASLREQVSELERRIASFADPSLRDPATAALRRAQVAIDEGRLNDAERDFRLVKELRWGESETARTAWRDAVDAEATAALLRGDGDRAEAIRLAAAAELDGRRRRDLLAAWEFEVAAAVNRYEEGLRLGDRRALDRAIVLLRDRALPRVPRLDFRQQWATTQINLGNALSTQGARTGGEAGLALLAEAVAAYRAALTVYTESAMPADWAMTQNNLGNALQTQGARTGGEAGLALLADAVAAYRAALTVRTESAMPAQWAMTQNNLGNALSTQGERTGGAAGLALLADAVAAYRAALTVRTQSTMPADWATTQENVALAFESMAALRDDPLPDLRAAETAVLAALRVYTPEHMSFYHAKATRLLARIRARIAERGS